MGPIKLRADASSIIIEDDLRASFVDDHAFSRELAVAFVKGNVTDMRDRPAVRWRQVAVIVQEFFDACRWRGEGVRVNANPIFISYHSKKCAVGRQGQTKRKGQV